MAIIIIFMVAGFIGIYLWEPEEPVIFTKSDIIGVVEIFGVIDDTDHAYVLSKAIEEALTDEKIKAIVLEIDSPGGSAYLIEQVYLDLLELKKEKPIVASVSTALSGGYYLAVSADYIFALPSAMVGNVGVIGIGPGWIVPSETTLETGPYKITGFSPESFPFDITTVLRSFSNAVEEGRGDTLNLPISKISSGSIWMGTNAKSNGLVDEIGSVQTAIKYAATLVNLDEYKVESILTRVANASKALEISYPSIADLNKKNPPPALYYLYLPESIYMQNETPRNETQITNNATFTGDIIVDLSHGNAIGPWILDVFTRMLTEEGLFVGFTEKWELIEESLNETRALVIACPTEYYTQEEYEEINSWVTRGGTLILLGDASAEFLDQNELQAPLNSLSNHWGIHFGNGYLYNVETNHGFYRNIIIDNIRDSFISDGVNELVFYTSGPVYSKNRGYASTSNDTFNSVTERGDNYDILAIYKVGNAKVVAFGDITWLMEPYINSADNYQLLQNLVESIATE
jgi:protease-4